MGKKVRIWCEKCKQKTVHEVRQVEGHEHYVCLLCLNFPEPDYQETDWAIDRRDRYSLRLDRVIEEDRYRTGRGF